MIIDLSAEMEQHLKRVKNLADEAADDCDQGYQSRASAMTAVTTMLVQLTKAQESLITMERLHKTEQTIIRVVKDYLQEEQLEELLSKLEHELATI